MSQSMVRHLIVKDFQLHRMSIFVTIAAGVLGLAIIQFKGLTGLIGIIGFFTTLIVLSCMLPTASIVNERKGHNLAFLMSLPISSIQYTTAKILAALGMFLIPWLTLVVGAVSLILERGDMPKGLIPITLILITLPLIGFCLLTAVALVGESEGWMMASTVAVNVSYSLSWVLVANNAELRSGFGSPKPIWSPTVLTVLGSEFSAIAAILAITLYLQSKKTDFV